MSIYILQDMMNNLIMSLISILNLAREYINKWYNRDKYFQFTNGEQKKEEEQTNEKQLEYT